MKRVVIVLILLLIVLSISSCYAVIQYFDKDTVQQYNKIMKIANEKFCTSKIKVENENSELTEDIIGVLEIEKLNIKAPVKSGTTKEVLKYSIGHFPESDIWDGNIALASHNRGSYAHYFENINELKNEDEIQYTTDKGTRKYHVVEKIKIKGTDWDKVLEKKEKNTLTLVTCITGEREYRLCVKAIEE